MKNSTTISKNLKLQASEDYTFLRQKGLEWIEALGSDQWTDYNIHDSGITILENVVFAQTELGYQLGFPIEDFLAKQLNEGGIEQGFFTAAEILTTLPVTINDYRKLLIDQKFVRNAWIIKRDCACEMPLFPDCFNSELIYADNQKSKVIPQGTYNILLEFEEDIEFGNLNDGKLLSKLFFDEERKVADIEIRFPDWQEIQNEIELYEHFLDLTKSISAITVELFNQSNQKIISEPELKKALRFPIKSTWQIDVEGQIFVWKNIPITIFLRKKEDANSLIISDIIDFLTNIKGIISQERKKLIRIKSVITDTRKILNKNRNLSEDFCKIKEISIEDIAVCADVVVAPEADLEKINAQIYFEIGQYFNPSVRFYSLQELLEKKTPTEEIFNGVFLKHGFVLDEDLEKSELKREIYVSDIINLLMDIEGVLAVQNVLLTKYDTHGNALLPSQTWKMSISSQHRPNLYISQSKILFYKNGLPFLPASKEEIMATLNQLKSVTEPFKLNVHENDLPVPQGTIRQFDDYFPIQFQFPLNYGISYEGLPQNVPPLRKAQAKQLKAYLLFYEQLLLNGFCQLENLPKLFSLDDTDFQTYFTKILDKDTLAMSSVDSLENDLYDPIITTNHLIDLLETKEEQISRKSTFIDHQLARFGENFNDYALLMNQIESENANFFETKKVSSTKLLKDKIKFLKNYSKMSSERFKAFDYQDELKIDGFQNIAGLKARVAHLLGLEMLRNYFSISFKKLDKQYQAIIKFRYENNQEVFQNITTDPSFIQNTHHQAVVRANEWIDEILTLINDENQFDTYSVITGAVTKWYFRLKDKAGNPITEIEPTNATMAFTNQAAAKAEAAKVNLLAKEIFKNERFFIVEHLLLRPRLYGQSTLPVCLSPSCENCGEENPYSFRLTFVMAGSIPKFKNLNFRRYAEQIIRTETPAHILPKICWVGNEIYRGKGIICTLLDTLILHSKNPVTDDIRKAFCKCAEDILQKLNEAYSEAVFNNNFEDLTENEKESLFDESILPTIICKNDLKSEAFNDIKQVFVDYFKKDTWEILAADDDDTKLEKSYNFQLNTFHKLYNEWLEENVKIEADDSKIIEKITLKIIKTHFGAIESEFSAATIPTIKANLQKVLLWYGSILESSLKTFIQDFINQSNPNPLTGVKINEIIAFLKSNICNNLEKFFEKFGDKLKIFLTNWAAFDQPIPNSNTWKNTILEQIINETINELNISILFINEPSLITILKQMIKDYYEKHQKYIFTHAKLIAVFGRLKSIYPPATLHDCEDGDDGNVVRLDKTVIL